MTWPVHIFNEAEAEGTLPLECLARGDRSGRGSRRVPSYHVVLVRGFCEVAVSAVDDDGDDP